MVSPRLGTIHLRDFQTKELEKAARRYIQRARRGEHEKRRRDVERIKPRFAEIARLVRGGELEMERGWCFPKGNRLIWDCSQGLHLVLIALQARMKRVLKKQVAAKPHLRRVVHPPGIHDALRDLHIAAHEVAQEFGAAFVLLFDIKSHFRSLNADHAIELFARETRATAQARTLKTVYHAIDAYGGGAGLQEGPSTSPCLAELATLKLDDQIRPAGRLIRYADNYALVVSQSFYEARGLVENAFAHHRHWTGSNIRPHEWKEAKYTTEGGFERFRLLPTPTHGGIQGVDFLGVHLVKHERLVAQDRLGKYVRERRREGRPQAQQVLKHYENLLTDMGQRHLRSVLRRAGGRGWIPEAPTSGFRSSQ